MATAMATQVRRSHESYKLPPKVHLNDFTLVIKGLSNSRADILARRFLRDANKALAELSPPFFVLRISETDVRYGSRKSKGKIEAERTSNAAAYTKAIRDLEKAAGSLEKATKNAEGQKPGKFMKVVASLVAAATLANQTSHIDWEKLGRDVEKAVHKIEREYQDSALGKYTIEFNAGKPTITMKRGNPPPRK